MRKFLHLCHRQRRGLALIGESTPSPKVSEMTEAQEIIDIEKELRQLGMTAGEFQRQAGVNGSTWFRIKRGHNSPNTATMRKIRETFEKVKGRKREK